MAAVNLVFLLVDSDRIYDMYEMTYWPQNLAQNVTDLKLAALPSIYDRHYAYFRPGYAYFFGFIDKNFFKGSLGYPQLIFACLTVLNVFSRATFGWVLENQDSRAKKFEVMKLFSLIILYLWKYEKIRPQTQPGLSNAAYEEAEY